MENSDSKSHPEQSVGLRLFVIIAAALNITLLLLFFVLFGALNKGQTDLDVLAVSITVLEVLLATIAVAGFWMIKGAAVEAGQKAGREETKTFLKSDDFEGLLIKVMREPDSQASIREAVVDWLEANKDEIFPHKRPVKSEKEEDTVGNIMSALDGKNHEK